MIEIYIDESQIIDWSTRLLGVAKEMSPAVADGMNIYAEQVVNEIAEYISESTGMDNDAAAQLIQVKEASEGDLSIEIDATEALAAVDESDWGRVWDERDLSQFQKEQQMRVVTMGDEGVCPVCADAATKIYTMDQIMNMKAQWAGWEPPTPNILPGDITNFVHPRCRCHAEPYYASGVGRRAPTTGQSRTPPPDWFDMQKMLDYVLAAEKVEVKVEQ